MQPLLRNIFSIAGSNSHAVAEVLAATIIEKKSKISNNGILSHKSCSFSSEETFYLFCGESFNSKEKSKDIYIKMNGRKIYEFAISHVPEALKSCLEKSGKSINDVKKYLIIRRLKKKRFNTEN